jgi:hypothetical protein
MIGRVLRCRTGASCSRSRSRRCATWGRGEFEPPRHQRAQERRSWVLRCWTGASCSRSRRCATWGRGEFEPPRHQEHQEGEVGCSAPGLARRARPRGVATWGKSKSDPAIRILKPKISFFLGVLGVLAVNSLPTLVFLVPWWSIPFLPFPQVALETRSETQPRVRQTRGTTLARSARQISRSGRPRC